eukprot:GEMP01006295.1.p1 GENE.GEMP01006295.1~~GEMP01006295.1.p1  ORF type:complete len:407 (-),score=106.76 GEMP01006295.1:638-1858(-)
MTEQPVSNLQLALQMDDSSAEHNQLTLDRRKMEELNTDRTRMALQLALEKKGNKGNLRSIGTTSEKKPEFVRYTPNEDAPGHNPACAQRIIRISEAQKDPMEPPKFKHMKVPRGPGTPPTAVMHSPARKLTAQDQTDWKIPPCVSSWKNARGYTIPLDKRLFADGRQLLDVTVNDKFAALSEDLYLSERKAREEIRIRNNMVRQKKVREADQHEQELRDVAAQAREQQAKLASKDRKTGEADAEVEARTKRMEIMNERKREIERDRRLETAGKKNKRDRDGDRDVSERIALGQAAQPTKQVAQVDSRLYNQSAGMDSGFGKEDSNNHYDKPLFASREDAGIYRHNKERMEQNEGRLGKIGQSSFAGAKEGSSRTAPVEFEREESDPFGLDKLASRASKKHGRSHNK